jgi:hypothetical protein
MDKPIQRFELGLGRWHLMSPFECEYIDGASTFLKDGCIALNPAVCPIVMAVHHDNAHSPRERQIVVIRAADPSSVGEYAGARVVYPR